MDLHNFFSRILTSLYGMCVVSGCGCDSPFTVPDI